MCENAIVPIIVILGHSEADMEVSDVSMETAESNNCREMSKDDGDGNEVLAII